MSDLGCVRCMNALVFPAVRSVQRVFAMVSGGSVKDAPGAALPASLAAFQPVPADPSDPTAHARTALRETGLITTGLSQNGFGPRIMMILMMVM